MQRASRFVALVVAIGTSLALVVPSGVAYAAYRRDVVARTVLPAGAEVDRVDVAGLTRDEAVQKVRSIVEADFDRPAVLSVGNQSYPTTKRELGVSDDAAAAVDAAFAQSLRGSWLTRSWNRLRGRQVQARATVTVSEPSPQRLAALVDRAVSDAAVGPVDAKVTVVNGFLLFSPSRTGLALDSARARAALLDSLRDGAARQLRPGVVRPRVADAAFQTALLVRPGENRLYVYKNHVIDRVFSVATGSPDYPTPTGRYKVTLKRFLPTWVNPQSEWSKNEPPSIPPGPTNPLGTRALNLSAPNIRIHGTPADASIGYSVSHGCIRMHMADVEALYPMVPSGTTVFIVQAGPPTLPGASSPVGAALGATTAPDAASAADGG